MLSTFTSVYKLIPEFTNSDPWLISKFLRQEVHEIGLTDNVILIWRNVVSVRIRKYMSFVWFTTSF